MYSFWWMWLNTLYCLLTVLGDCPRYIKHLVCLSSKAKTNMSTTVRDATVALGAEYGALSCCPSSGASPRVPPEQFFTLGSTGPPFRCLFAARRQLVPQIVLRS